jgi:uroporphyrinogen-III synthase
MPFDGLRVLSLESRRTTDMDTLIKREGGVPAIAPSLKESGVDEGEGALRLVEQLETGEFDLVICMTGVGLKFFHTAATTRMPEDRLKDALRKVTIVARGPKPVGVLRGWNVPIHVTIPEPNTWREIVAALRERAERRIVILEYGRSNGELIAELRQMGASVTPVVMYRWDLPDDTAPLRQAARDLAARQFDVLLLTSSIQLEHLLLMAREEGVESDARDALLHHVAIGSIGEVTTEFLGKQGFSADIVPAHPKMWALAKSAGEQAHAVIARKRAAARP